MYNPPVFKSADVDEALSLMDANSFATVITVVDGDPVISHLPLVVKLEGDSINLIGHLARMNPHWKSFSKDQNSSNVTVVFQGAHTYISPEWYTKNDVPTWNYSTVHVKGKIELIEDYAGIVECLKDLSHHVEKHWPSGWQFQIPEDLEGEALSKHIVAFRIKVHEFDFKKKLSQNRSLEDRSGVMLGLETRSDENSRLVLREMKKNEESKRRS